MHQAGYKVVGIGEWDGGLYNSKGIDITALWEYARRKAASTDSRGGARRTEDLLITDCEILVPAATEASSRPPMLTTLRRKSWSRAPTDRTTAAADDILADKHVFVMPDIWPMPAALPLPTSSGYRTARAISGKRSVVNEQLEHIMVSSFEDVVRYAETHKVNNRIAAYMLAIDRVAYTIRQRGIYA